MTYDTIHAKTYFATFRWLLFVEQEQWSLKDETGKNTLNFWTFDSPRLEGAITKILLDVSISNCFCYESSILPMCIIFAAQPFENSLQLLQG